MCQKGAWRLLLHEPRAISHTHTYTHIIARTNAQTGKHTDSHTYTHAHIHTHAQYSIASPVRVKEGAEKQNASVLLGERPYASILPEEATS